LYFIVAYIIKYSSGRAVGRFENPKGMDTVGRKLFLLKSGRGVIRPSNPVQMGLL
jgi:hypothetical protein